MKATERWQQVDELFDQALDRPFEDRAAFVHEASGDDELLRTHVMRLLAADAEAGRFLDSSAARATLAPMLTLEHLSLAVILTELSRRLRTGTSWDHPADRVLTILRETADDEGR